MSKRSSRTVLWICAFHLATTVALSFLIPIYRGPDELQHVDRIRSSSDEVGAPDPMVETQVSKEVGRTMVILGEEPPNRPPMDAESIPERGSRPRFDEVSEDIENPRLPNHLAQHPPLYYHATAAIADTVASIRPQSAWPWDREVFLFRWIGALFLAPMPLLAAMAMSFLDRDESQQILAAVIMSSIGGLTFIGSVVNNDALAILASSILLLAVVAYHQTSRNVWMLIGAAGAGAAAFTKSTSLTVAVMGVGLMGLSVLLKYRTRRSELPWKAVLGSALIVSLGCSWHVRQLIDYGDIQPNTVVSNAKDESALVDVWGFIPTWFRRVGEAFWGLAGRRSGVRPAPMFTVIGAALMIGSFRGVLTRKLDQRFIVWGLGCIGLLQVGLMFRTNLRRHLLSGGFSGLQARYIFPAILAIVVVSAVGAAQTATGNRYLSVERITAAFVVVCFGIHLTLGYTAVSNYWAGPESSLGTRFETILGWSPWGNFITVAALVSPLPIAIAGTLQFLRDRRDRPADADGQPALDGAT